MNGSKVKIVVDGKEEVGTLVDIIQTKEHFNEVHLSDGGILKAKLVISGVVRIDGQKDDLGCPVYVIQSTNVVSVSRHPNISSNRGH